MSDKNTAKADESVSVKSNRPLSNKTVRENNPLLKQLLFDNPSDNDAGSDITFQFPLQTVSVLFEIEDKLKNDSSAYKCLMDKMFTVAGFPKGLKPKIYTLMKFLMSNELASKISMFGTYSKLCFCSLKLYEILHKVLLKHIPEVTAKTLQSPIQCWLYNASRRLLQKQAISQNSAEH